MTDPVAAALISAVAVETAAIISGVFMLLRNKRNNKKSNPDNNPGSLHDVLMLLTEMNGKLDELLRR